MTNELTPENNEAPFGLVIDDAFIRESIQRVQQKRESNYKFFRRLRNAAGAIAVAGCAALAIPALLHDHLPKAVEVPVAMVATASTGVAIGSAIRAYQEGSLADFMAG